ncbi:MAG: histidine kinase, partial [Marinobacter sp.]
MAQPITPDQQPITDTPPSNQRGRLFRIYNHYRVVVSVILVALLFVDPINFDSRFRSMDYYQAGVVCYLAINGFI